jgi:hypothetical protein
MNRVIRRRPSPAIVIASMALMVALGGTGYAAIVIPNNSVGTAQLKNNAVISSKVKHGSLKAVDFAAGQIPSGPAGAAGPAGPAGAAGPAGPSDAYSKFANSPIVIPTASPATLTSLNIPQAGSYVIIAKTIISASTAGTVFCGLTAETDSDLSGATLAASAGSTIESTVVHTFNSAGTVNFACQTDASMQALFIRITAIKVGNLVNTS